MRKTEILFAAAAVVLFAIYLRKGSLGAMLPGSSTWSAGKCQGNTVPGYWADVQ